MQFQAASQQSRFNMTAADRVYQEIKNGILCGEFASGLFIREEAIARQLAVSRTPIREAIRRLVSEGWLESIPNCGARVVEWSGADVEEVFELRSLLEPLVAKRAAARLSPRQIEELDGLAVAMEALVALGDGVARDEITQLNQRLHQMIAEAAASPRIQRILQSVVLVPIARRSFHNYTAEELQRSMSHHQELIRALKARDGEWAAAVMRTHILAARAVHMRCAERADRRENGGLSESIYETA
jgi:DNA-binding GntR family transcriptional regulator